MQEEKAELLSSKPVYVTHTNKPQETVLPIVSSPKKIIVLTNMSSTNRAQCEEIINKLGKYRLSNVVDENTSRVIAGTRRKTKAMVQGISQGVWILSPEWLIESQKQRSYVSKEPYELASWYPNYDFARQKVDFYAIRYQNQRTFVISRY